MSGEAGSRLGDFAARGLIWLAAVAFLTSTACAELQSSGVLSGFPRAPSFEESLADEYGQAMISELARLMSLRSDAACLKSRNWSEAATKKAAAAVLGKYGRKAWALRSPEIDRAQLEAAFIKIASPQALADMCKVAATGVPQRYAALVEPMSRDVVIDVIADDFDRYLDSANFALGQTLSPISSGNRELSEVRMRREDLVAAQLQKASSSDAVFGLLLKHLDAIDYAAREIVLRINKGVGPERIAYRAFTGVEVDLRNACVRLDQ